MLSDKPAASDLLATAVLELRNNIAGKLSGEDRLTLLMAISAIETAIREGQSDEAMATRQKEALSALLGADALSGDPTKDTTTLAKAIRAGDFDSPPLAETLHAALLEDAKARAAISNPRYLQAAEADWKVREQK